MNKSDLVDVVADAAGSTKVQAEEAVTAFLDAVIADVKAGLDAQGNLVRLARRATELERISTLKDYGKGLIRDGIAVNAGCCFSPLYPGG